VLRRPKFTKGQTWRGSRARGGKFNRNQLKREGRYCPWDFGGLEGEEDHDCIQFSHVIGRKGVTNVVVVKWFEK